MGDYADNETGEGRNMTPGELEHFNDYHWYVYRDGKKLAGPFVYESMAWNYLHNACPASIEHACKHEGYSLVQGKDRP